MPTDTKVGGKKKRVDASSLLLVAGLNKKCFAQILYPDSNTGSFAWEKAKSAETRAGARWVPDQPPQDNSLSELNQMTLVPMNGG